MRTTFITAMLGSLAVQSAVGVPTVAPHAPVKVLINNDDGWEGANIRASYQTLSAAGYDAVLSAPLGEKSGTGSTESSGVIRFGANATDPRLNYVDSYPVDATKYGIKTLAPKFFGGPPDILVAGPNFGSNTRSHVLISGTVGAAVEAAKQGILAIAFSTPERGWTSYTLLQPGNRFFVYAQVAQRLVDALTATPKPWLPQGVVLNVNFWWYTSNCAKASDFYFALTRVKRGSPGQDAETCDNRGQLETEGDFFDKRNGCRVSVSVINTDKTASNKERQAVVLEKLSSLLVCASK